MSLSFPCARQSLHALQLSGDGTVLHKFAKYAMPVAWSTSDPGAVTSSPLWHQLISGVHESKRSPPLPREGLAYGTMKYLEYRALALKLPSAVVVSLDYCTISLSTTMESDYSFEYLAYRASALVEVALSQDIMAPDPSQLARVSSLFHRQVTHAHPTQYTEIRRTRWQRNVNCFHTRLWRLLSPVLPLSQFHGGIPCPSHSRSL